MISRVAIVITHIGGLITPLITTHEPPSRPGAGTSGQGGAKGALSRQSEVFEAECQDRSESCTECLFSHMFEVKDLQCRFGHTIRL